MLASSAIRTHRVVIPMQTLIACLSILASAALAQQPRIDSLSPPQGPIAGGTVVTIKGANFSGAVIALDRVPIAPISQSDSEVRVRMTKHDNGYVVIAASNLAGTAYGDFLYLPPALQELPPGYITTVAGVGRFFGEYGLATRATVSPWGLAFDRAGNTYIADTANDRVVRIRADGILEPFAGNGRIDVPRPAGPAPALDVSISYPRSIAVDGAGNVYIPDSDYYLWRVSPDGVAQIIAGTGKDSSSGDGGPAVMAGIGFPNYVAVDGPGNVYFISYDTARIRKIDRSGIISTIAGTGIPGFSGDGGPATQAQFKIPGPDQGGLAADEAGNLFLLDYSNARIRRIDATTGVIMTVVDAALARTALNDMKAVATDRLGNLYFSQAGTLILRRSSDGTITQLSSGRGGFSADGTLFRDAPIGGVAGLAIDGSGELAFSETARVRKVDANGRLQTLAGVGPGRADEGAPALEAVIVSQGFDVDFLPSGELIFDDIDRIRKIDRVGIVATIAGIGTAGPLEGVPAAEANIAPPSVAVAADGSIDFASRIFGAFTIGRDGILRRSAGQFTLCDFTGDGGNALEAKFCQAWDAIRDRGGNLLIADTNNNRIRRVDRVTGIVTTIAGSGASNGWEGYGRGTTCGDGGPATAACINTPYGIAVDDRGNLYVSEVGNVNGRIRKIDPAGIITTFAEVGTTKLTTFRNHLYAVSGDRVLRFSPDGAARVVAGTPGQAGFSGDGGPATEAMIRARGASHGIAVDAEGNLFFSDGDNRRIRAVRYGAVLAPPNATIQAAASGSMIRAMVFDSSGNPAPAVRVDFTPPSSGASCIVSSSFAITDANGVASVSCSSNCIPGTYAVTAQPMTAASTAAVPLTNGSVPCRRRTVRH